MTGAAVAAVAAVAGAASQRLAAGDLHRAVGGRAVSVACPAVLVASAALGDSVVVGPVASVVGLALAAAV